MSGLPVRPCFRSGSHTQWLTRQRTFIWRSALLRCSLRPPAASVPMPCRCSRLTAMSLFPTLTAFNFPGNSGMARVMCVALQVAGPGGRDRQVSMSALRKPQNNVFQPGVGRAWTLPDKQVTCASKMVFCPRILWMSFRGTM